MNLTEVFFFFGTIFFILGGIAFILLFCFVLWSWCHFRKIKRKTNSFLEEIQRKMARFFDLFSNITTLIGKIFETISQRKKEAKKVKE